jgi:hypothetical protein
MKEEKGNNHGAALVALGTVVGGLVLADLLRARPVQSATETEKLDYITNLMEALVKQDGVIVDDLGKILDALLGITPGGLPSSILTPWVAGDPDLIFEQAIRNPGVFFTTKRVDFRRGKRLALRAENTMDQPVILQTIGNFMDSVEQATDINGPIPCVASGNTNIGLAWDDWQPYIAIRITVAVAPTIGFLRIYSVMQE